MTVGTGIAIAGMWLAVGLTALGAPDRLREVLLCAAVATGALIAAPSARR